MQFCLYSKLHNNAIISYAFLLLLLYFMPDFIYVYFNVCGKCAEWLQKSKVVSFLIALESQSRVL